MEDLIHREAKYGYTLCGKSVSVQEMSLDDDKVNCPDCRRVLEDIRDSDTKTKLLRRFFHEHQYPSFQ